MKRGDGISTFDKENNDSLFSFFANKFLSFLISRMSANESFVEKLQRQSKEKLQK